MKIAYLSFGESPHDERFLSKMIENGHEPFLISYFGNNLVHVEGVKVYKYNYRRLYAFNRYITPFLGFQFAKKVFTFQIAYHLKKLLKYIQPDILHTNFIHYEGFCGALSGFRPIVSTPWGSDVLINPKESRFGRFAAKYTLNRAARIAVDCQIMKDEIFKIAGIDRNIIDVFPFGIDLKVFSRNSGKHSLIEELGWDRKRIILSNRSFKEIYGIKYFIEALPSICKNCEDARVLIVGDGPDKDLYLNMVNKYKLSDKVFFTGKVSSADMPKILNCADIYVSVSLSDGTPVSLLEAFACGLPVVVTDLPAVLEWVEDDFNGLCVKPKDSISIAKTVIALLKNENKR